MLSQVCISLNVSSTLIPIKQIPKQCSNAITTAYQNLLLLHISLHLQVFKYCTRHHTWRLQIYEFTVAVEYEQQVCLFYFPLKLHLE